MHESSLALVSTVLTLYGSRPGARILEVGSLCANAISLRPHVPVGASFVGVDRRPGEGVDEVVEGSDLPFAAEEFDLVVSTSAFEHDPWFWVTFEEMVRVCKPGGVVYVNAPAKGSYHAHPGDCWRFYPDAGEALASWARRRGRTIRLIETFLAGACTLDGVDVQEWIDCVMLFGKGPGEFSWPSLRDAARGKGRP